MSIKGVIVAKQFKLLSVRMFYMLIVFAAKPRKGFCEVMSPYPDVFSHNKF